MYKRLNRSRSPYSPDLGYGWMIAVGIIATIGIIFIIIGATGDSRKNTDPRKGMVYIGNTATWKICDGTTLVYVNPGNSTIPNSPECH